MRHEIEQLTTELKSIPTTFLEIGSRDGFDTKQIADYWNLDPKNCYIIEAHPDMYKEICKAYPQFNTYHFAASNEDGTVVFNAVTTDNNYNSIGTSSVLDCNVYHLTTNKVEVEAKTIFSFLNSIYLNAPDLVKIDVEGFTLQVLQGFGDRLNNVKALQIETEKSVMWKDQATHDKIVEFMESHGFILKSKYDAWNNQYDCLFIKDNSTSPA